MTKMNDMKTIPLFQVHMPDSVDAPLLEMLHSGYIGQGVKVDKFEDALIAYIGNPYIFTTNSGTSALIIALRCAGVKPRDTVISTPMTCSATNMAIKAVGADIIWADINPRTGNIDPESVRAHITPTTKAIVCVHWGGYPNSLDDLLSICEEFDIQLIEDSAHALGAEYHNFKIGNYGHFSTFSLQAIKNINTIEGGFVCCNREDAYKQGKLLRWFGIDREGERTDMRCEQDIIDFGYKANLVDPLAVIGIEQMKHLESILKRHRENAEYYIGELSEGFDKIQLLDYEDDRWSSYWLFSILVDDKDKFRKFMADNKIIVSAVHSRNDVFSCFADSRQESLPGVDYFDKHQVSIPVHWGVTDQDRERIMEALEAYDKL